MGAGYRATILLDKGDVKEASSRRCKARFCRWQDHRVERRGVRGGASACKGFEGALKEGKLQASGAYPRNLPEPPRELRE
jgi:hypothetical protein